MKLSDLKLKRMTDEPSSNPDEPVSTEADTVASQADDAVGDAFKDQDRAGLIRQVPGAHLIYKRENNSGTFDELWIYNVEGFKESQVIRQAILSGTDIDPLTGTSEDGEQTSTTWQTGNVEFVHIENMQN